MGPLDAVIQLLLFVCFGVYVVMGLTFLIMGIIYYSDEGAVGSTGIYLILLGLLCGFAAVIFTKLNLATFRWRKRCTPM